MTTSGGRLTGSLRGSVGRGMQRDRGLARTTSGTFSGCARVPLPESRRPRAEGTILDSRLDLAREFIANGVPVFIAKKFPLNMTSRAEYDYPKDWQTIPADERYLDGWKPIYAVCAVTGIKFDVVDIDPRNGGDTMELALRGMNIMPPVCGTVATPSGGSHYYVSRTHLRKHTPWTGVDLQAGNDSGTGRGFVFIPPTRRKGKHYQLTQGVDWEALKASQDSPEYVRFLDRLTEHYDFTEKELRSTDSAMPFDEDDMADLIDRIVEIAENIRDAPVGTRDTTLNKHCYTVGGLIAASPMDEQDEQQVVQLLQKATDSWDITQSERDHWVTPKILSGIEQGKHFPILGGF